MTLGLQLVLLGFALIGFAGCGAALAVSRGRQMREEQRDAGMLGVACMLFLFGALCTAVAAGGAGVPALGGVTAWASYLFMAQHLELFRIEVAGRKELVEAESETPRSRR